MQCEVAGLRQTFSFSLFISIWTDSESSARRNCIIGKYWVESCLLLVSNRFQKFHYWRLGSSKWLTVALWIILTTFQITGSKFCWTVSRCGFQALSGWTPGPSKHTRISRCVLLPSGVLGGWLLFCGIGSQRLFTAWMFVPILMTAVWGLVGYHSSLPLGMQNECNMV